MRLHLWGAVVAAAIVAACAAAPAEAAFGPCPTPSGSATCETLAVPIDPSGAVPGAVHLFVERRAAAVASAGPLVVLAGGPGQAATPFLGAFEQLLAPALGNRDLIVFDQRGTGRSDRLSCPALGRAATRGALDTATEACARSLGPRRAFYTSRDTADDIDAIRRSLGVDRISLYGVSYGTYTAITYARRYPLHVESLILDSSLPPGGRDPFDRSTFAAVAGVLRDICARDCRGITRNLPADLGRLVRRLRRRPLAASVYAASGRRIRGTIGAGDVLAAVEGGDLDPTARAELPAAVHSALLGDGASLGRLVIREQSTGGSSPNDSDALFLATSCEEEPLPWSRTAPLSARPHELIQAILALPAAAFAPWGRSVELQQGTARPCLRWPDGAAVSPAIGGPLPNVPALILSGVDDTRTPTSDARQVARLLPQAQLVTVPDTGHSVLGNDLGNCSQDALRSFAAGTAVRPCPAGAKAFPPVPVAPLRLAALRGERGIAGNRGLTATAVRETLADTVDQVVARGLTGVPLRGGGLRGGSFRGALTGSVLRVTLDRVVYVPGVEVSGRVALDLTGLSPPVAHVTVGGTRASHGTLTVIDGTLSGRLSGRSVHTASAAAAAIFPAAKAFRRPLPLGALR